MGHLKQWTSKKGIERGGKPFTKSALFKMLTNATYLGKVAFKGTMYEGEHEGIVDPAVWEAVQQTLKHNGRTGGAEVRNRYGAILKGLLYCVPCNAGMVHTYTSRGSRRYRYYVCATAQQRGWGACKTKSVSAPAIEDAVLARIKNAAANPEVLSATLARLNDDVAGEVFGTRTERDQLRKQLRPARAGAGANHKGVSEARPRILSPTGWPTCRIGLALPSADSQRYSRRSRLFVRM